MLPTSLAIAWPLWRRHRWGCWRAVLSGRIVVVASLTTALLTHRPASPSSVPFACR